MATTDDFTSSELDLNGVVDINSPTSLVWGPDGRLYVTQQDGSIEILTVVFGDSNLSDNDTTNGFYVSSAENVLSVQSIPNHNDDGSDSNQNERQVTGIDVVSQFDSNGNPVLINGEPAVVMYVTSSDTRIGAGSDGDDSGLDTNSGVLTRLTQTANGWETVDIVRGLSRSEENHATNGLEVIQELDGNGNLVSERLILANGGNANAGAPSNNFAGQQETPYSAAILEIDLDEIRAIEATDGVKTDDGREYVYDLPTLNDPLRTGANDADDPFGGNDGLNSAKLIADGPVQIYSAGYRNAFDVEVTDDGRVFTYDNGANNNWGGRPAGEDQDGDTNAAEAETGTPNGYISTNLFVEDNSEIEGNFDPQNWDQLHEVTRSDDLNGRSLSAGEGGAQTYLWDHPDLGQLTLVYGGHPNPTRAEGARAGLLYTPEAGVGSAKLMVSNVSKSDGNGGTTSDFLEVVAWFDTIGYSNAFINETVVAVIPGTRYSEDFASGFGVDTANGRPSTTGVASLVPDANGPVALPADIDDIVFALNDIEGNYLEAGFNDGALDTGKGSINGLTEYTSTIFDDANQADMQGALIAASLNQGEYYIIGRDANGVVQTTSTTGGNGNGDAANEDRTVAADKGFLTSGGAPLGLASIGDELAAFGNETAFRGTIWSAIYKQNGPVIEIFQPGNPDTNALLGADNYAGQQVSDPTDNDLDGVDHFNDPFDFDADNGLDLVAGQTLVFDFNQVDLSANPEYSGTIGDTGLMGAALDGVTPNRDAKTEADGFPANEQEDGLFDNAGNIIPGGNAPILQIKDVQDGTAIGSANTLLDGLQTGVKLDDDVQRMVASVEIFNWYADQPGNGRISGLVLSDGTQSNFLRIVFGDIGGQLGVEVGIEIGDSYTQLGTSFDSAFVTALTTGGNAASQKVVTLELEISDIGGDYTIAANFGVNGETSMTSVSLSNDQLPAGVLRDVLDGTHTITDGDTTLNSGAAVGIVTEKDNGASFTAVDFDEIRIEGFGNEIYADTEAEAEVAGTSATDTVIYTGGAASIQLDPTVENFDGSGSAANWDVDGTPQDNLITVGAGTNTITTGAGTDEVVGTKNSLNADEITDLSATDKVVITDADASDANNVIYQSGAGSAIVNVNGTILTFSGPQFDDFDPASGASVFSFVEGDDGLEITLASEETVLYRVNAAGDTIAAIDGGPDWQSDADFYEVNNPNPGPITISGLPGNTYSNSLSDEESEIEFDANVDGAVVPWQVFVDERSDNNSGGNDLSYNFEVETGKTYKISFYYTENFNNIFQNDNRVFDVAVEGTVPAAFDDLHPLREITDLRDGDGAPLPTFSNGTQAEKQPYLGTALMQEYTYTAGDDILNLTLKHNALTGFQSPKVNAIQISELSGDIADVTPPTVDSIVVEDSISDSDSPRLATVTVSDSVGLDLASFNGLDGSELVFTGITPDAVSAPVVTLSQDQKTATLVYTLDPPSGAWPTGTFNVGVAAGTFEDAEGNDSAGTDFDFTFAGAPVAGQVVLAINAGGGEVDGAAYGLTGVTFQADTTANPNAAVDFSNTTTGNAANGGNNTNSAGASQVPFTGVAVPDEVFTTERFGNDFSYNVDLPDGTYLVDLYFVETFVGVVGTNGEGGGVGDRVFDANIEGNAELDNYDLYDDGDGVLGNSAGAPGVKVIKTFEVLVTDGQLNIQFDSETDGSNNAEISAIVVRVPDSGATAEITGDESVSEDEGTASYTVTLSEAVNVTTIITVDVSPAAVNGAAISGDVTTTGGGAQLTLTFEPGEALSQSFDLNIVDDTLPEFDESFTVSISGLPLEPGKTAVVTTTIVNDDGPVDSAGGATGDVGDFADNGLAPTDIGILALGETTIVASQQGDGAPGGRDRDYVTFTVAEGQLLTGIILDDWDTSGVNTGTPQAFIGLQAGSTIDVDPVTFVNAENLLGGYVYGTGDVANGANVDGNLLTPLGDGEEQGITFGDGSGFAAPLPAGQYTIWLNQGDEKTTATLKLVTADDPTTNGVPTVDDNTLGTLTVDQDGSLQQAITFTDPEGSTVTYALADDAPAWLSINAAGILSGTPTATDVDADIPVTILASDPEGGVGQFQVFVTVNNVNDAPTLGSAIESQSAALNEDFFFELPGDAFIDLDAGLGDALTFSATLSDGSPLPNWLSINPASGTLSGTPDTQTDVQIVVTATDGSGQSISAAAFTIEVNDTGSIGFGTLINDKLNEFTGLSIQQILANNVQEFTDFAEDNYNMSEADLGPVQNGPSQAPATQSGPEQSDDQSLVLAFTDEGTTPDAADAAAPEAANAGPEAANAGPAEASDVLLRINAFGAEIAATDGGPNWLEDTQVNPSEYYEANQNRGDTDTSPATPDLANVPNQIFATARSDNNAFSYDISVADLAGVSAGDTVTVNLFFAEAANGSRWQSPSARIFDVEIEGALAIDDLSPIAAFGSGNGGMISTTVTIVGNELNIDFLDNNVQNAIVSGIEIVAQGEVVEPPVENTDVLEILGVEDGDFDGIVQGVAVDSVNDGGNNGSVVLTITDGKEEVDTSNFTNKSLKIKNTGDKEIAAVFIDIRSAVFGDMVFDVEGKGGDTASKPFSINDAGETGAYFVGADSVAGNNVDNLFFAGDDPLPDTSGRSGGVEIDGGYRGLLIRFDGSDGGFEGGEEVAFSGDGDPNSIAGFNSGYLKPNNVTDGDFDIGGQSGSELVGSSFTVLFADGTTAVGYLGSDTTQAGAAGEAIQGRVDSVATLSVDTGAGVFDSGDVGTYGGTEPEITVTGTPGDVVRVTLHKGFQPVDSTAGGDGDKVFEVIEDRLAATHPDFAVNAAFDVQTVDVTIGANGTATVPAGAFDYVGTQSGVTFVGDDVQPLALTAAVVEEVSVRSTVAGSGDNDLIPVGPVSTPIYLSNPSETPVRDVVVVEPNEGYFEIQENNNGKYFKIQIEDPNGSGGATPGGKWDYETEVDAAGNQAGFQGSGYYVYGSPESTAIDNAVGDAELLEYDIFIPEDALGVYSVAFIVSRDGLEASDQQNDLWLNFKHAEDDGLGDIEEFLTDFGTNEAEPAREGFVKLFGGKNTGAWSQTDNIDGAPKNFDAKIEITEAGLYTVQVEGRSQGYHIDYFEIFQEGANPSGGADDSVFIETGTGGGNGTPVANLDQIATTADSIVNFNILANDTDPDGDDITVIAFNEGDNDGLVSFEADGSFTFNPNGVFDTLPIGSSVTVSYSYTISDGEFTDTGIVNVTVNGTFDDPDGPSGIVGDDGDNVLEGTEIGETIQGLGGKDEIYGGGGDDLIIGGTGNDLRLYGGEGSDTFMFNSGDGRNIIRDFELGEDLIGFGDGVEFSDLTIRDDPSRGKLFIETPNADGSIGFDVRVVVTYDEPSLDITEDSFVFFGIS